MAATLTDKQKYQLKKLINSGMSAIDIHKLTGYDYSTIYRYKPAGANRYKDNSHHPMLRSGVDDKFLENSF